MIHADKFVPHVDHRAPICDEFCRCMECKPSRRESRRRLLTIIGSLIAIYWIGLIAWMVL